MVRIKNILVTAFLLYAFQANAQIWWEKRTPHVSIWEYPRSNTMNLLDREYSRSIHFGFALGLNAFDFSRIRNSGTPVYIPEHGNVVLYSDLIHIKPGFSINAIADYRLITNLDIRFIPGIFFGQRQLDFYRTDTKGIINSMQISSNYLEFPVVIKHSAERYTNFRPYMLIGLNTRVNLSNKKNNESGRYIELKKLEPFAEIGFGFDFYFDYFRMGLEFKLSTGLINCLSDMKDKDMESDYYRYYRQSLKSLRSNTLGFAVSFEL